MMALVFLAGFAAGSGLQLWRARRKRAALRNLIFAYRR